MLVFNEILVVKLARAGNQFLLPQRLSIAVYQNKSALRVGVGGGGLLVGFDGSGVMPKQPCSQGLSSYRLLTRPRR